MSTATPVQPASTSWTGTPQGDQCVAMAGVSWALYEAMLGARGDRRRPRFVYLDGVLHFMSPAFSHEQLAERLGDLVKIMARGLKLPYKSLRSTTLRLESRRGGAEADASFYLANAPRMVGRRDIDLLRDPPPDLTVEVEHTHPADAAVEVWRRLGVPEVWVADARRLRILTLQPDATYQAQSVSRAFPWLTAGEILDLATRDADGLDSDWSEQIEAWVAGPLADRVRDGQAPPPPPEP